MGAGWRGTGLGATAAIIRVVTIIRARAVAGTATATRHRGVFVPFAIKTLQAVFTVAIVIAVTFALATTTSLVGARISGVNVAREVSALFVAQILAHDRNEH